MRKIIDLKTDPRTLHLPDYQIAQMAGVSTRTIVRYKQKPEYHAALREKSDGMMLDDLPRIDAKVVQAAKTGSHRHQKLYYERTNVIEKGKGININVGQAVNVNNLPDPGEVSNFKDIVDANVVEE